MSVSIEEMKQEVFKRPDGYKFAKKSDKEIEKQYKKIMSKKKQVIYNEEKFDYKPDLTPTKQMTDKIYSYISVGKNPFKKVKINYDHNDNVKYDIQGELPGIIKRFNNIKQRKMLTIKEDMKNNGPYIRLYEMNKNRDNYKQR